MIKNDINQSVEKKTEHSEGQEKNNIILRGKDYLKTLGPGLVTGAADDDPSGVATYSQTGAQYGTGLLWLSVWIFPLVSIIQEMCARIALVTGRGLASNIKSYYSRKVLYLCTILLFFANTLNIGADLGAMAKAVQLISPKINFSFLVIFIGTVCLLLLVLIPYRKYVKYLKWLAVTLLAYVATGFIIQMDWGQLFRDGLIPNLTFSKNQILLVTAILGTTISPYLFFWETSQEVEEQISEGKKTVRMRRGTNNAEIKRMRLDVWSGMFFSNLIMFFIIAVCATTLFKNGITNINSAADAAMALKPLAGQGAFWLFAFGILSTGMLAIPILASSTSYAISESLGWKEGLFYKLKQARSFYGIIIISIIVGILINFIGIDPIKALIYSAIANGIIAPIIIICIVHISGNGKIMGKYKNHPIINILGWLIVAIMATVALATIVSLLL